MLLNQYMREVGSCVIHFQLLFRLETSAPNVTTLLKISKKIPREKKKE